MTVVKTFSSVIVDHKFSLLNIRPHQDSAASIARMKIRHLWIRADCDLDFTRSPKDTSHSVV